MLKSEEEEEEEAAAAGSGCPVTLPTPMTPLEGFGPNGSRKRMLLRRLAPAGRSPATVVTKACRSRASKDARSELSVRRHEATRSMKSSLKHVRGRRGSGCSTINTNNSKMDSGSCSGVVTASKDYEKNKEIRSQVAGKSAKFKGNSRGNFFPSLAAAMCSFRFVCRSLEKPV